jgi:2-hydroxychromene-2-carboxylate isomerase
MTRVEAFVDPSCPWSWITSRWLTEVAPARDLALTWRSYSTAIRDNYGAPPNVPAHLRQPVMAAHALAHRMLRIFEAARAREGEEYVGPLYTEWGRLFFTDGSADGDVIGECLRACGLDPGLQDAAGDERWDKPIVDAMQVARAFGGPDTQFPTIVVGSNPAHGFKGPVMSPAPTGEAAVRLWDAIQVIARESGFFEITRPRANPPWPAWFRSGSRAVAANPVMDDETRLDDRVLP